MKRHIKYKDELGQHMTPAAIADMVCDQLPGNIGVAVDFAVGNGDLMAPLMKRFKALRTYGIDCDKERLLMAEKLMGTRAVAYGDGLRKILPDFSVRGDERFLIIGNPPYLPTLPCEHNESLLRQAFPDTPTKHGLRRLEMAFFARALIEAKKHKGLVALIMPSALVSGIQYESYRNTLQNTYGVLKSIEIKDGKFRGTEASTVVIIIDTAISSANTTQICHFDTNTKTISIVYDGVVVPGQRLDASYWSAASLHNTNAPTLRDIGTDITRGKRSKAEAARVHEKILHTTDLSQLRGQLIHLSNIFSPNIKDVVAETGDILLPRTGTRVRWQPIEVANGSAPISDHVLRIRAPQGYQRVIKQSFNHPSFPTWLKSVSKGVCATVITKRELLDMPLFALCTT